MCPIYDKEKVPVRGLKSDSGSDCGVSQIWGRREGQSLIWRKEPTEKV